jgi:hypothetical protein
MAGTLLSGFRIRLADRAGNPLYPGRVSFFDAGTSVPKTVYADYELATPLGTTVDTDIEGYLPAVWCTGGLYDASVQQRIVIDPETWETLWTIDNIGIGSVAGAGITSNTVYVENIASMRALPSASADIVICAGYYVAGDCGKPLTFTWQPNSTRADDAGAYIRDLYTPPGSAGRYHQMLDSVLDVRSWGALPDNPSIDCIGNILACENYAVDPTVYPNAPPVIAFIAPGKYQISGTLALDAQWHDTTSTIYKKVPYCFEQGAYVQGGMGSMLSIQNPTIINSNTNIVEYPTGFNIAPNTVEYFRPQWLPNYHGDIVDKTAIATGYNIPIRIFGIEENVIMEGDATWEELTDVSIDGPFTITIPDGITLTIKSKLTVKDDNHIFVQTGNGKVTFEGNTPVNASWFGYSKASGTSHGTYIQLAIDACSVSGYVIIPPVSDPAIGIYTSVSGEKDLGKYVTPICFEQPVKIFSGGSISGFSIEGGSYKKFDLQGGTVGKIHGNYIDPFWWEGLAHGFDSANITNNHTILSSIVKTAMISGVPINGFCRTIAIRNKLTPLLPTSADDHLEIKDLTIKASSWNGGTSDVILKYEASSQQPTGEVVLDNVNIDISELGQNHVSLYAYPTYLRVTNCSLMGDCVVAATSTIVSGTTFINSSDTGIRLLGAQLGATYTGNHFINTCIKLRGDGTVKAGRTNAMLEHIVFNGNTITNTTGDIDRGVILLETAYPDTVVDGVIITDNSFVGLIDSTTEANGARIRQTFVYAGTWVANAKNHSLIIKNNSVDPSYKYNHGPSTVNYQNFCPCTEGYFHFNGPATVCSANVITSVTGTYVVPSTRVFQLLANVQEYDYVHITSAGVVNFTTVAMFASVETIAVPAANTPLSLRYNFFTNINDSVAVNFNCVFQIYGSQLRGYN